MTQLRDEIICLTHWGRVMHICVGNLTIIGSDNGLSPGRRQAIIWTNAGILLIGPLETNFSEILIEILTFPFKQMCLKVSSAEWRPFCLGLNVLTHCGFVKPCWDRIGYGAKSILEPMLTKDLCQDMAVLGHTDLNRWRESTIASKYNHNRAEYNKTMDIFYGKYCTLITFNPSMDM